MFYSEEYNERNTDPDTAAAQELLSGKRHATGMEFNLAGRISPSGKCSGNHTWIPDAKIDRSNVGAGCQRRRCAGAGRPPRPHAQAQRQRVEHLRHHVQDPCRRWYLLTAASKSPRARAPCTPSGFVAVDAMVEYAIDDKTSVKLNVNNLFDKVYADSLYRGF